MEMCYVHYPRLSTGIHFRQKRSKSTSSQFYVAIPIYQHKTSQRHWIVLFDESTHHYRCSIFNRIRIFRWASIRFEWHRWLNVHYNYSIHPACRIVDGRCWTRLHPSSAFGFAIRRWLSLLFASIYRHLCAYARRRLDSAQHRQCTILFSFWHKYRLCKFAVEIAISTHSIIGGYVYVSIYRQLFSF